MIDYAAAREAVRTAPEVPERYRNPTFWTRYKGIVVPVIGYGPWASDQNPNGDFVFIVWHEGEVKDVPHEECKSIFKSSEKRNGT